MKKIIFFMGLCFCLVGSAMAQSALYPKTKSLQPSEVPATVLNAFEEDFSSNLNIDDGRWSVVYLEEPSAVSSMSRFEPVSYSFVSRKKGSDDIRIEYSPSGELESVEGIASPGRMH